VVEGKNLAVPWLEPRDLEEESLSLKINDSSTNTSLSSAHSEGVMVLLADGSAKFLRSTTDPQLLKALLTIAGGEPASVP
jgi:prepilin-type processing-associated H-X9-DG protein